MPVPQEAAYAKRKAHALVFPREASSRLLAPVISHRLASHDGKPTVFLEDQCSCDYQISVFPFLGYKNFAESVAAIWMAFTLAVIGRRVYPLF